MSGIVPSNKIKIGDGQASNKEIEAHRGSSTNPKLRWNESTSKWQFSNDGTNYSDIGTGTGGGSSGQTPVRMVLSGGVTVFDVIDGSHRANEAKSLTKVALSMLESGDTGSTTVRIQRDGTSGPTSQNVSLSANGGLNSNLTTLGSPIDLVAGDVVWADVTAVAGGAPEDLTAELIFE